MLSLSSIPIQRWTFVDVKNLPVFIPLSDGPCFKTADCTKRRLTCYLAFSVTHQNYCNLFIVEKGTTATVPLLLKNSLCIFFVLIFFLLSHHLQAVIIYFFFFAHCRSCSVLFFPFLFTLISTSWWQSPSISYANISWIIVPLHPK